MVFWVLGVFVQNTLKKTTRHLVNVNVR